MPAEKCLVLLDTDRIHDYVFATNKLKEIRGASAILDELNSKTTCQILGEYLSEAKYECDDLGVIFLGGGSGKIIFADGKSANDFCQQIQRAYLERTDNAASITTVCVPKLDCEDFDHWIYRGEKELRKKKDSKYLLIQPLTNQYFKICESTGIFPAERTDRDDIICKSSSNKRSQSDRSRSYFAEFKNWVIDHRYEIESDWKKIVDTNVGTDEWKRLLPGDLNTIGSFSNNYVSFIYADGNRMGQKLSGLKLKDEYKNFSDAIRNETQEAIFHALSKHLSMDIEQNQESFPFEILLMGGDDLMAIVPADKGVKIAIDFCDRFKRCIEPKIAGTHVSISAGVLITHVNYPIHRMIDHGEDLLKSAKSYSNDKRQEAEKSGEADCEVNAIDFMVLKGAMLKGVKEIREGELSYLSDSSIKLRLYNRPYTTADLTKLVCWIRKFKKSDFPKNKLKDMYEALYRGKGQAMLDYHLIASRLPKSGNPTPKDVMLKFCESHDEINMFPWKKKLDEYYTPFLDMIELYDFVE